MKPTLLTALGVITAALLLAACTTTRQAHFYRLDSAGPVPAEARLPLVVAIGPVDLPQYLDRPHIVTRAGKNRLRVDEFNRWAGALEEDITRVLAHRISARLATRRIYRYPSRVDAVTDYRVALDVSTFDGALGGAVDLALAWSVIDDRSGRVLKTDQRSYRVTASGAGYEAYAAALSELLAQLGDDIAVALRELAGARKTPRDA